MAGSYSKHGGRVHNNKAEFEQLTAWDDDENISPPQHSERTTTVTEGYILDFISGEKLLKDTPKEQVRQRIARALFHEYGISVDDMRADFPIRIDGRRKKVDIAIFHQGQAPGDYSTDKLSRIVVCRQEPKVGRNTVRIRDYNQASKDLAEVESIMQEIPSCKYGLWTNGIEFFYLEKKSSRFEDRFEPIGDWPPVDESMGTRDVVSTARMRKADPEMLRTTFRRCHNFIHGNEGMPKDAAFWQFLYLIFCKMYDERVNQHKPQFWVGPQEQFDEGGRQEIRRRIAPLFEEVKQKYSNIFRKNEEIVLSDRALAFMVSELAKYNFTRTEVDAKGAAYQEIVGTNLRGDRGQYFTPRGVIWLAVQMLNPQEEERVLDPACGTGGFLVATLQLMLDRFKSDAGVEIGAESTEEILSVNERLRKYAEDKVYGADFDPFLIKASQMNMVMAGDGHGHLYNIDSLDFPNGHLSDLADAKREISLDSIDVVMTNPPFGSDIPITDSNILSQYELAQHWERLDDGSFRSSKKTQSRVSPQVLFVERCLRWLKPGGRMGIVLPNGILSSPGTEYIRWWILRHAWVLASVEIPTEAFIVEANVGILTSLLLLKKKTREEMSAESIGGAVEYPIFMAVAEKVGFDRRGNTLYRRSPDGEDIIKVVEKTEHIRIGERLIVRSLRRKEKEIDDDLPLIAERYQEFLSQEATKYPHLATLPQLVRQ